MQNQLLELQMTSGVSLEIQVGVRPTVGQTVQLKWKSPPQHPGRNTRSSLRSGLYSGGAGGWKRSAPLLYPALGWAALYWAEGWSCTPKGVGELKANSLDYWISSPNYWLVLLIVDYGPSGSRSLLTLLGPHSPTFTPWGRGTQFCSQKSPQTLTQSLLKQPSLCKPLNSKRCCNPFVKAHTPATWKNVTLYEGQLHIPPYAGSCSSRNICLHFILASSAPRLLKGKMPCLKLCRRKKARPQQNPEGIQLAEVRGFKWTSASLPQNPPTEN